MRWADVATWRRGTMVAALVVALMVATVATACGASSDPPSTARGPMVDDGWARPTPPVGNVAAFYATIEGPDGDDRLLAASSERCQEMEIHQTTVDGGSARMTAASGAELVVGPDSTLELAPNGLHLMCLGLDEPLVAGQVVAVELTFERAGTVPAEVVVDDR